MGEILLLVFVIALGWYLLRQINKGVDLLYERVTKSKNDLSDLEDRYSRILLEHEMRLRALEENAGLKHAKDGYGLYRAAKEMAEARQ